MEVMPTKSKTFLQESHKSSPSQMMGVSKKLRFVASSWIPMAFPQFRVSVDEVRMAMPEGRYSAEARPHPKESQAHGHEVLAQTGRHDGRSAAHGGKGNGFFVKEP